MPEETVRELAEIEAANGPSFSKETASYVFTQRLGDAYAAIARAYCEGGRKPLSAARCGKIAQTFGSASSILSDLEHEKKLLIPDGERRRDRPRVVVTDVLVLVLDDDGVQRQVWPLLEEDQNTHAPETSSQERVPRDMPIAAAPEPNGSLGVPAPTISVVSEPETLLPLGVLKMQKDLLEARVAQDRVAYADWKKRLAARAANVDACRVALEAASVELAEEEARAVEDPDGGKALRVAAALGVLLENYEDYQSCVQRA